MNELIKELALTARHLAQATTEVNEAQKNVMVHLKDLEEGLNEIAKKVV